MTQTVDQVRLNAHTADQGAKMADEFRARPVADLQAELLKRQKALSANLKLASRNGEDGETVYDLHAPDEWKDKTDGEVREIIAKENDALNVMGAVIGEKTFMNDAVNAQVRVGNQAPDSPRDLMPLASRAVNLGISDLLAHNDVYRTEVMESRNRNGKKVELKGEEGRQFINAVFQRSGVSNSGWAPEVVRSGRVVESATRPIQLIDMLPTVQATGGGYKWMQEAALSAENTSNRVPRERNEGQAVEQITVYLTEKSVSVQKMGALLPMTEEQLADEPGARAFVEMRLPQQVRQRLDYQAVNGSGAAPFVQGFAGVSGINSFDAASSSKILDQFIKAAEEIYNDTYGLPNLIIAPMAIWTKVLNSVDDDGNRLFGDPSAAVFSNQSVWGIRFAVNAAVAANTAYALNTAEKLMVMGDGVEVVYGYNSDDFAKSQITIRCTLRAAFADLRPTSTCKIGALTNAS